MYNENRCKKSLLVAEGALDNSIYENPLRRVGLSGEKRGRSEVAALESEGVCEVLSILIKDGEFGSFTELLKSAQKLGK